MNITIKDIEDLQNHLSTAICAQVEKKMDEVGKGVAALKLVVDATAAKAEIHSTEIARLKGNQAKALVGWTVLVAGVSLLFNHARTWIMSKVHLNG